MTKTLSNKLTNQQCAICRVDSPKVSDGERKQLLTLIPNWHPQLRDNVEVLERKFTFKNYQLAWQFTNKVSALAEHEGHHPAILLEWGQVTVTWWTHAIMGLHQNDFICAAKTDQLTE